MAGGWLPRAARDERSRQTAEVGDRKDVTDKAPWTNITKRSSASCKGRNPPFVRAQKAFIKISQELRQKESFNKYIKVELIKATFPDRGVGKL